MRNSRPSIVLDDLQARLRMGHLVKAVADWSPVTEVLSHKLRNSVVDNFDAGGRYDRAGSITGGTRTWAAKADGTQSYLQASGILRGSILPEHDADTATVSTNIEYAARMNFGEEIAERSSLMTRRVKSAGGTPPRPFMVVQAEDVQEAKRLGRAHLLGEGA